MLLKPFIFLTAILLLAAAPLHADIPPAVIPKPVQFHQDPGTFAFSPQTRINAGTGTDAEGRYLGVLLAPALGQAMDLVSTTSTTNTITLQLDPQLTRLGKEGYTLAISPTAVKISAPASAGIFYGIQTLRQLLPPAIEAGKKVPDLALPCYTIEDQPRYPWRGLMIDTSRHFFPKSFILREIDLLALHKLNILHLHLTDDQGWRIEIKKYPKLTEVGAWRRMLNTDIDWAGDSGMVKDGQYGGFYTQDDIRQIVAFAASRHVTVVPEIEMPGHSQAALAAYPEISCTGGPFVVATNWGVHPDVYCAGKEKTFEFLQGVLDEVCDLFPGSYIHIGGDECPKDRWLACPDCKKRMADNNLKTGQELQSYFIKRIGAYLASKKRNLIGWNEILEGGLGDNAAVMSWQGMDGGTTAAKQGHNVVMSPESNCYFDHASEVAGVNGIQASVALSRAYGFLPTPPDLSADLQSRILGAQGNVWAERIPTSARSDFMTFPRACALAEALWTAAAPQDYTDFAARLLRHYARLDALGVKYDDDPMAHAVEVGQWLPAQLARNDVELSWDITAQLKTPGRYTVRFEHADGRANLLIHWAELRLNSAPASPQARDTHEAQAGGGSRANTYLLTVPALSPGDKYTLHASVRGNPGTDTRGQVFLMAPLPATRSTTLPAPAGP